MIKRFIKYIFLVLLLTSCTVVNTKINRKKYNSVSQNERINFIVLHYTATNDDVGIRGLTQGRVSSHYLITSKNLQPIYNLVPDDKRAWHAGVSEFAGRSNINDTSIGIEIVSLGVADYKEVSKKYGFFVPYDSYIEYSEGQIKKVIKLLQELTKTYKIDPTHIVGHSDVAPTRKIDPGAKFPWEMLYRKYNIGAWYDEEDKEFFMNEKVYSTTPIKVIKDELRTYGYAINTNNEWDEASKRVVYAFQSHFNPKGATGEMNLETFAILKALNKKYRDR